MLSWLRIGSVSRQDKVNEWASDLLGFLGVVTRLHKCSIAASSCCVLNVVTRLHKCSVAASSCCVADRRQPIVKACAGICSRKVDCWKSSFGICVFTF